jgi:hypothetical protein
LNLRFLYLAALIPLAAQPGELRHAGLLHRGGEYIVHVDADMDANSDTVHAILTDYERLERISPVLDEATLISTQPLRLRLRAHTCILFYCFHVKAVGEIVERGPGFIAATLIPGESDFRQGALACEVQEARAGASRVHLSGTVVPAFWIPPVIGPYILQRKLVREAGAVIDRIEALAAHE